MPLLTVQLTEPKHPSDMQKDVLFLVLFLLSFRILYFLLFSKELCLRECGNLGKVGGSEGGGYERESKTQASPAHTRQEAEADFLGGLTGGGDALSHSQNAMEFCRTRQPSTCSRRKSGTTRPQTDRNRTHSQIEDGRAKRMEHKKTVKVACA